MKLLIIFLKNKINMYFN